MPVPHEKVRSRIAAAVAGLVVSSWAAMPAHAQLTDAQVCVNPALKDPIIKALHGMKAADVQPSDTCSLGKLIRSGAQLKGLSNDTLVSRTRDAIVCRYDASWSKAGASDTTVKFIIKVTSGANGSADVDAYVE